MTTILGFLAHSGVVAHAHPHAGFDVIGVAFAALVLLGITVVATIASRRTDVTTHARD